MLGVYPTILRLPNELSLPYHPSHHYGAGSSDPRLPNHLLLSVNASHYPVPGFCTANAIAKPTVWSRPSRRAKISLMDRCLATSRAYEVCFGESPWLTVDPSMAPFWLGKH